MVLTVHHIVSTRQMRRELSAGLSQTSTGQFLSATMDFRSAVPSTAEERNCNKSAAKSSWRELDKCSKNGKRANFEEIRRTAANQY